MLLGVSFSFCVTVFHWLGMNALTVSAGFAILICASYLVRVFSYLTFYGTFFLSTICSFICHPNWLFVYITCEVICVKGIDFLLLLIIKYVMTTLVFDVYYIKTYIINTHIILSLYHNFRGLLAFPCPCHRIVSMSCDRDCVHAAY